MRSFRVVALLVLIAFSSALQANGIAVCKSFKPESGLLPDDTCPAYITGATHGLHYAMSQESYGALFCLPPESGTEPTAPYNQAVDRFRNLLKTEPSTPILLATLGAMMDEFPCDGATPDAGISFLSLGQLLGWCKAMLEVDREGETCGSYLFGLGQSLVVTSGQRGSRAWVCPPGKKLASKTLLTMALDHATDDPETQSKDFVQTIASLLEARYPCD